MDEEILDNAFVESDDENGVNGDENSADASSDTTSKVTPAEPLPKKKLTFSSVQDELEDSFAALPSIENPAENSPWINGIDIDITALSARIEKLEEAKRRRQVENAGKSAESSSDKMHDCPAYSGKEQASNKMQQRSSGANAPEIKSISGITVKKRKSDKSGQSVNEKMRVAGMENKTGTIPAEESCPVTVKVKEIRKQDNLNRTNFVNRPNSNYAKFNFVTGSQSVAVTRDVFQFGGNIPPNKYSSYFPKLADLIRPPLASVKAKASQQSTKE